MKFTPREMCFVGIFAALIAVGAQISFMLAGGVPLTFQSWGVVLAGLLLGKKNGAIAAVVYVLLGAAGMPVFANLSGGLGVIMRPAGGFLLSFPLLALFSGLGAERGGFFVFWGIAVGEALNLFAGMLWFSWVTGFSLGGAFSSAVAPFIFLSVARVFLMPLLGRSIKIALVKAKVAI